MLHIFTYKNNQSCNTLHLYNRHIITLYYIVLFNTSIKYKQDKIVNRIFYFHYI